MMFWQILRRLLISHRARLAVVLVALSAGAGVTAALLNLEVDAERRLTREFRALGANVLIAPRSPEASSTGAATMEESLFQRVRQSASSQGAEAIAFLYVAADIAGSSAGSSPWKAPTRAIAVGTSGIELRHLLPAQVVADEAAAASDAAGCTLGASVAEKLHRKPGDAISLRAEGREESCVVSSILSFGGAEDSQIFLDLPVAQQLAGLPGRISLIQISVPGTPQSIERSIANLQKQLPEADVHGIRQFTEAESQLYGKIRGLLLATVALILLLTALCVMAAMTNVALERQRDVGLMKAIGGAASRVMRLFFAEAALLGLVGGLLGAVAGLALSVWLGKAVFGVAAQPRLIVYPVAVALTVAVAVAGAFPLRRLAGVRPGEILRSVS